MSSTHEEPSHRGSLDEAFDEVQIGLALITLSSGVVRVNPAGAALLGRAPEDLAGTVLADLVHDEDIDIVDAELVRLAGQGSAGPILVRLEHRTGGWRWVRAHATLLTGEERVGFVVFEDVTEELSLTDALRAAEERNARRLSQQMAVVELGRLALSGSPPEAVVRRSAELVLEQLGAVQAAVLLDDGHEGGLLQVAGAGAHADATGTYRRPRDDSWGEMLRTGKPHFIADLLGDEVALSDHELAETKASGLRSVVLTPIAPAKARRGVLTASSDEPGAFDAEDAGFLEALAHVIAAALDSAQAVGELRHQALHDPLTELPNRVLVMEHLALALSRARRQGGLVAVVMCDVDRFKCINDTHGHDVGDDVLRTIGRRIASHLRPGDLVGRFGGDELVVVLTELEGPDAATAVAQRLVEQVRLPISVDGGSVHTTVSAGVAVSTAADESGSILLRRADQAMYEAKAAGGDRCAGAG